MRNHTLRDASLSPEILPSPPSSSEIPNVMEGHVEPSLVKEESSLMPSTRLAWLADAADLFVLLFSLLLTMASITLAVLIFKLTAEPYGSTIPNTTLSILQRMISTFSLSITSAVMVVAGKRYVLFKLARGCLRSQRVAVYSNPTIGNLAIYSVLHRAELPLLGLSAVWILALVTSLTVNDSWKMGSTLVLLATAPASGQLDPPTSNSSWVDPAIEQLTFVMWSWCLGLAGSVRLINVTNADIVADPRHQMGIIYYPPLPSTSSINDYSFSTTATMNGVNISITHLFSVPHTAQNLSTCLQNSFIPIELWYDGSDNETFSIVIVDKSGSDLNIFRIVASAIIMGGTLSSSANSTEFALNGTSWPNVMPAGNGWAGDVINIICNTTIPVTGTCSSAGGSSLSDFVTLVNSDFDWPNANVPYYRHWHIVFSMALGAYSSAVLAPQNGVLSSNQSIPVILDGAKFTSNYGVYVLLLNIVISLATLVVVVKLRLASHIGADFINPTRLLLDPLKTPKLFNASLKTTMETLSDPYMIVEGDALLLAYYH